MTAHGEPAGDPAPPTDRVPRGKFRWVTWSVGIALFVLLIVEGMYLWPRLHESWKNLTEIHGRWVVACILLQAVSMSGYGRLQKRLLRAGGVEVSQRTSVSVVYGSTGMALTLPAGQVFSTAFTYWQTRRWGASPIVASWQLVMSGVVATAGLALLGVGGTVLVGDRIGPWKPVLSLGGIAALIWVGHHISRHPGSVEARGRRVLHLINRIRRRPPDDGMNKFAEILDQLESVDLGTRDGAWVTVWALVHRFADVACLGAACYAVGAEPKWSGLMLAFTVGKAVGTIPFAPGGIVYVDAALIYSLTVAAGLPAAQAVAAAFVYRLVSFILVAIVGWIVFAFLFRKPQAEDAEFEKEFEQRRSTGISLSRERQRLSSTSSPLRARDHEPAHRTEFPEDGRPDR